MANPRPLKLSNAALLNPLKNAFLEQNWLDPEKKSKFWPSKWRFFKNVALEPIWVGHGWFSSSGPPFRPRALIKITGSPPVSKIRTELRRNLLIRLKNNFLFDVDLINHFYLLFLFQHFNPSFYLFFVKIFNLYSIDLISFLLSIYKRFTECWA